MSDLPTILTVKARSFPKVDFLRDVGVTFLSLAHAEAHYPLAREIASVPLRHLTGIGGPFVSLFATCW